MRLFVRKQQGQRQLALVASEWMLLFMAPPQEVRRLRRRHSSAQRPMCLVSFSKLEGRPADLGFVEVTRVRGFLGLLYLKNHVFLGVVTRASEVGKVGAKETIYAVGDVEFHCLDSSRWDAEPAPVSQSRRTDSVAKEAPKLRRVPPQDYTDSESEDTKEGKHQLPCQAVKRLLSNGSFYFSPDFDITTLVQARDQASTGRVLADVNPYLKRFLWNRFMVLELMGFRLRLSQSERTAFDSEGFMLLVTRGSVVSMPVLNVGAVGAASATPAQLTLVLKQSCMREGPLFGEYGLDDAGNTADFVETEMVFRLANERMLYVLLRGDVPIIYETHSGKHLVDRRPRVEFRRLPDVLQQLLAAHFEILHSQFREVCVLHIHTDRHLLEMASRYQEYTRDLPPEMGVQFQELELHGSVPRMLRGDAVVKQTDPTIVSYGAFFYDAGHGEPIGRQMGVFRISCNDLERADAVERLIARRVMALAFSDTKVEVDYSDTLPTSLDAVFEHAWTRNHEELVAQLASYMPPSQVAAPGKALGTKQASGSKTTLVGLFAKRYLVDPVADHLPKIRHYQLVEKLLGRVAGQFEVLLHDPVHDYVTAMLEKLKDKFTSQKEIRVYVGTFNVNAQRPAEDLTPWVLPPEVEASDICVFGLQEVVELKPGKMLNVDDSVRRFWGDKLLAALQGVAGQNTPVSSLVLSTAALELQVPLAALSRGPSPSRRRPPVETASAAPPLAAYSLLWDAQLGGLLLLVFARRLQIDKITNVEGSILKTGFGGMASNKGGVAVLFRYSGTRICCVTLHLAAGLNNLAERHIHYKALADGLRFQRNARVRDHDIVLWFGDFNYRIDLSNEEVRRLVAAREWARLFEHDQLNEQMSLGELFPFFNEAEIAFAPTYKFDKGTQQYDTLEKHRVPAWCDRIVSVARNGSELRLEAYMLVPQFVFSDHKPVYGVFTARVSVIDGVRRSEVSSELYEKRRREVLEPLFRAQYFEKHFGELAGQTLKHGLPPPLLDTNKWWLAGGEHARVELTDGETSSDAWVVNPRYPKNPFDTTSEPVFIERSELDSVV